MLYIRMRSHTNLTGISGVYIFPVSLHACISRGDTLKRHLVSNSNNWILFEKVFYSRYETFIHDPFSTEPLVKLFLPSVVKIAH